MDNIDFLNKFRELLVEDHKSDYPEISNSQLNEKREEINKNIKLETPMTDIELDSMKMTWVILQLKEAYNIDISKISFFELENINDLANQIINLMNVKE